MLSNTEKSRPLLKSDVRVWRETDASGINAILNHPEVRPWVADMAEGVLDVSHVVANDNNILLMGEHGAIIFVAIMPGTYECHTQILPSGRGEWSHKFAIAVLDWMFLRSNAWEVCTRIPRGHIGALALTRSMGFRYEFTSMEPCLFRGKAVSASTWTLTIHEWISRSALCLELGKALHEQMQQEALRLCIRTPPHNEDDYHDQIAGAAIEMARQGLTVKGTLTYNRWSALARHRTIGMVSAAPPVIRMDLGNMRIKQEGIEIFPC